MKPLLPTKIAVRLLLIALCLAWLTASGSAGVSDLRSAVSSAGNLIHHYTFEGATNSERLADKVAGGDDLSVVSYGTGSSTIGAAGGINFSGATFDVSTSSLTTYRTGDAFAGGAGLSTVSDITLPTSLTVEAIIRPLSAPVDKGFAVMTQPVSSNRGYYVAAQRTGLVDDGNPNLYDDRIYMVIGDSFTEPDNVRAIEAPYFPGDWYYVANTYEISGGNTTITSYSANLTRGETTLTKVLDGVVASGDYGSAAPLGIGVADISKYYPSAPHGWAFDGQIDEVALYDAAVGQATIENHFSQLTALDPATERIVTFGDSTTAARAIGGAPLYGYTDQLRDDLGAAGLNVAVYNQGISGNTTNHAAARLDADVRAQNPDTVIVQFGINEEVQGVSLQDYTDNLTSMVRILKGDGADVILMTPNPTNVASSLADYAQAARDVAAAESVDLVDVYNLYNNWIAADPGNRSLSDLLVDNYHPNATGHELTATALAAVLIPEPSTLALLAVAALGIVVGYRRRRR